MSIANRHGIGPRLLGLSDDGESVRYEYVHGLPILDHLQQRTVDKEMALDILRQVFAQLLCLDRLRLNKHEMTWPAEHILIEAAAASPKDVVEQHGVGTAATSKPGKHLWRPVLIDFERCTANAAKPRNATQFLQFLATPTVMKLLSSKRIPVDVPRLRIFGSEYKTRLATLDAAGSSPDQGAEGSDWDFVEMLGLTGEPRDEPVSTDVTTEPPRGRAARKLQNWVFGSYFGVRLL